MKTKFIAAALALSSFAIFGGVASAQEDASSKAFQAYEQEDYVEAARWFRLAADQGDAGAQFSLGFMYANGKGVPENDVEALKWYRLAADQGDASAQNNLGFMYANGRGVPEDFIPAYKWWNLAAAQGNDGAIKNKEILRKQMTPAQIAQAQKLSSEWKPVSER